MDAPAMSPMPRLMGLPLVGNLPSFVRDPLATLERARVAGDVSRLDLGPLRLVTVHHPELADRVLRQQPRLYTKGGPFWGAIRAMVGNGLVVSDGPLWRRQRRMMQPQFKRHRMAGLTPLIVEALHDSIAWTDVDDSWRRLDVGARMPHIAMSMASAAILGIRTSRDLAGVMTQHLHYAFDHIFRATISHQLPRWVPMPGRRRFQQAVEGMQREALAIIGRRRAELESASDDLLTILVRATDEETGQGMSDTQLRDETLTMFIAGYETTSCGLQWSLELLARHPEHLDRLRAEVDAVLGGRDPEPADLERLSWARWIMQEALRLYPPAWWIPRQATEETELGGHRIEPGTFVAPVVYTIQRHPDCWEAPERFDPERFEPARVAARHSLAWLPFGAGPRKCIGEELSLMEAQLALSMLVQRYEIEPTPDRDTRPHVGTVLRPTNGVKLRIRRRR